MLLVIHNLPSNVKYAEIKALIQSKCGLTDFVLDNLLSEGATKRVTVGLADDGDAAYLVRKINGLYLNNQQLYVEDVRQTRASDQPYRPKPQEYDNYQPATYQRDVPRKQNNQEPKVGYQNNLGYQDSSALGYQDNSKFQDTSLMNQNMAMMMNYNNMAMGVSGMYYPQAMSLQQPTGYLGYGDKSQQMTGMVNLNNSKQDQSFGYGEQAGENSAGGWDDVRPDHNRRTRGKMQRSPSPRGQRGNSYNAPASRWEPPKPVPPPEVLRRSPSPPRRNWDNGPSVASFAKYYENSQPTGRNEPQNYGQQRTYRSNLTDQTPMNAPAANIFGEHVVNQQNKEFSRNQPWNETNSFQRRGREDAHEPRGGNFAFANKGPKPFGRRDRDDGPKNWRDQPKVAPKRFAERWQDNQPPQKKFLQSKGPRQDGANTKNWRENAPRFQGGSKFENPPPVSMTKMLNKDDTWRGQAAANLGKDMVTALGLELPGHVMTRLKRSIRSRINLLLGSTISNDRLDIEKCYRGAFPISGDSEFVQAVVETVEAEQGAAAASAEANDSKADAVKPKTAAPKPVKPLAPKTFKTPKPAVKSKPAAQSKPAVQSKPGGSGKLPKFPNADKKGVHRQTVAEREKKDEITKELSPSMQKALEEEVDELSDLFMSECMDPNATEQEKVVCEEIADVVSDEFRKVIRLHMTKRLLNMNANLAVRAIAHGKMIHRDLLEAFVKDYGAVALKKSDKGKFFLVHIDSFKNYDRLCAVGEVSIGGFSVRFKPLHVLGAPPSAKEVREQMLKRTSRFMDSQIDKSGENLLEPGYSITPTVDSVAAQKDNTENPETGDHNQENGDQSQENGDQSEENGDLSQEIGNKNQEIYDLTLDSDDQQTSNIEMENPETGEVNVDVGDGDQEGEVYDIEDEEEEIGDYNEENDGQEKECEIDEGDCDPEEAGGENVDEDDLEDY